MSAVARLGATWAPLLRRWAAAAFGLLAVGATANPPAAADLRRAEPGSGQPGVVCSAYTFRNVTLFEAVERTAQCGITAIETYTNLPLSPDDPTRIYLLNEAQRERLRKHLDRHGVRIVSCMGAVPRDEQKARAFFQIAKELGASNIGTDSVDAIDTIERIIGDYDLTVAFHNHPPNPQRPGYRNSDPAFMKQLLAGRHPRIGVCADTGHYATSNVVPLEAVKLLADRIKSVHLKDRAAIGRRTPDQVLGTGVLEVAGIMDELKRHAFRGWYVIEYESNPGHNLTEVAQCAAFIRSQLTEDRSP